MQYLVYDITNRLDEVSLNEIWGILEESFIDDELRTLDEIKSLINDNEYFKLLVTKIGSETAGLLFWWDLPSFIFIENFAVKSKYRDKGIGRQMLEYIKFYGKKELVLEAEPGVEDIQKRRLAFYERFGFKINTHDYVMPALRNNTKPVKLLILTYPKLISVQQYESIKTDLYEIVYKGKHI